MGMSRSSDRFALGQQIGSYRLIKHLGKGGFADVYLGEHIYLQNQNAIKILRVQLSEDSLQDFLNEAKTIARLDHPNIVRVLDYGVHEETPFLVMGYAPNGSLRTRYPRRTLLPLSHLISIIQQMASALDYAHQLKLIHRDIKPENMLIGPQQQILLSDFGLALAATSSTSQASANTAGTVPYMAPEQLQGRVRYSSDQYSLAVTVYEWLCGERPFNGSFTEVASQHVLVPPSSLRDRVPNLPPAVEQVVFKALAKDPTQRFETVQAFAHALQQAAQLPVQTYTPHSSHLAPSATFVQLTPPTSHLENNDEFHTVPMTNNFTVPFTPAPPTLSYPPYPPTSHLSSHLPPTNTPPSPFASLPTRQMAANAFSDEQLYTPYTLSQPLSTQHQHPASQHLSTPPYASTTQMPPSTQQRPSTPYYPPDLYITSSHNTPTKRRSFPLWQALTMVTILLLLLTVGLTLLNLQHRQHSFQLNAQTIQPAGPNIAPGNSFATPPPQDGNGIAKPISNCLDTVPSHLEFTSSISLNTIPSHIVSLHCPNDATPMKIIVQTVEGKNWLLARDIPAPASNDSTPSSTIRVFAIKDNLKPGIYHGALTISQGNLTATIKVTYTLNS